MQKNPRRCEVIKYVVINDCLYRKNTNEEYELVMVKAGMDSKTEFVNYYERWIGEAVLHEH